MNRENSLLFHGDIPGSLRDLHTEDFIETSSTIDDEGADERTFLIDKPEHHQRYTNLYSPFTLGSLQRHTWNANDNDNGHSRHLTFSHSPKPTLTSTITRWIRRTTTTEYDPLPDSADLTLENNGIRFWYEDYSTIDWLHDAVKERVRLRSLRQATGLKGRIKQCLDKSQGWIAVILIGILVGCVAAAIDVVSELLSDLKTGYCSTNFVLHRKFCCWESKEHCSEWIAWSTSWNINGTNASFMLNYILYVVVGVGLAICSSLLVLTLSKRTRRNESTPHYQAAGSGIPEVKTILGGFVIRGFLGFKTLVAKVLGLTFSVASGLTLGKEGPLVHIACGIGNVLSRFFTKYFKNEGKKREILSAASAAGVAVAFGSPIGGVLFSLEEVSYYFPSKTMWRSFVCAISAAMTLKMIDPFRTGKIVMFQVSYNENWHLFELIPFLVIGVFGGVFGIAFIKLNMFWSRLRKQRWDKYPVTEVLVVTIVTLVVGYLMDFTRIGNSHLVAELLKQCSPSNDDSFGLCDTQNRHNLLWYLLVTLVVKAALMVVTFGIRVPAGIFIPSLVVGTCFGRVVGIVMQTIYEANPNSFIFQSCSSASPEACIIPGVYALIGAAAALSGVTRMTVSLAVIVFELTGALSYVLPVMLTIMVAKWVGDAVDPASIYDRLIIANGHPYLDHKHSHPRVHRVAAHVMENTMTLDIARLYTVYELLQMANNTRRGDDALVTDFREGGFPLLEDGKLVGFIGCNELTHAIEKVKKEGFDERRCVFTRNTNSCLSTPNSQSPPIMPINFTKRFPSARFGSSSSIGTELGMGLPFRKSSAHSSLQHGESVGSSLTYHDTVPHDLSSSVPNSIDDFTVSEPPSPTSNPWVTQKSRNHSAEPDALDEEASRDGPSLSRSVSTRSTGFNSRFRTFSSKFSLNGIIEAEEGPLNDFTPYIDQAPLSVSLNTSLEMILEIFIKLGIKYLCVVDSGIFRGVIYKKRLLAYLNELDTRHD